MSGTAKNRIHGNNIMKNHMKNLYKLICCAIILAGCVEENLEPIKPAMSGDEIIFGARAGFEDSDQATKTVYSGETYELNGKIFERIDWLDGSDKIEIYCKEAANGPSAHYVINDASTDEEGTDQKDEATLTRIGDGALQWNGDGDHTFYAMYPSSMMFTNDMDKTVETGIFMSSSENSVVVNGIVPSSQQPTVEEIKDENGVGTKNYIAKPDMNYAYMVAKSTANRANRSVGLSFVPIVTAVEIELFNANIVPVNIGEIQVSSDEPIVGSFQANLTDWEDGYPGCIITKEPSAEDNNIQITTRIAGANNLPVAVPVAPGKSLKFTVFLLPGASDMQIGNLTLGVSITGTNYKEKKLEGADIKQHLKTRISKINLPELTIDAEKWMESVNPLISFKALSLPGTGGSFTSYAPDTVNEKFRQQTLNFGEQWKLGIRAFEIASDRPSSTSTSLGGETITCNKEDITGWTVIKVIRELLAKVSSYQTETAALILTYQPEGSSPARNVIGYAQSFKAMLTANANDTTRLTAAELEKIIAYTPDLTMESARGKLILICRPSQRDEENNGSFTDACTYFPIDKVTAIDGCGTARDKWGARGYKVTTKTRTFERTSVENDSWNSFASPYKWGEYKYGSWTSTLNSALDISNKADDKPGMTVTEENGVSWGIPESANSYQRGIETEGYSYVEGYMQSSYLFASGSIDTSNKITYPTSSPGVSRPAPLTLPKPGENDGINFGYTTNIAGLTCWFQEWSRVFEANKYQQGGTWQSAMYGRYPNMYWFESYYEKLSNVITTFEMAISNQYSNYVFINSLCGYLAEDNNAPLYSLTPSLENIYGGDGGNIQGLADKLNPAFYQYVLHSGMEEKTGPTGIVLMDFVSDTEEKGGAYYLPGTIIANNFKFD